MKRSSFTRRGFLAGTLVAMPLARSLSAFTPEIAKNSRTQAAFELRKQAALTQSERPIAAMIANGDDELIPGSRDGKPLSTELAVVYVWRSTTVLR